jgi:hypothetical protein
VCVRHTDHRHGTIHTHAGATRGYALGAAADSALSTWLVDHTWRGKEEGGPITVQRVLDLFAAECVRRTGQKQQQQKQATPPSLGLSSAAVEGSMPEAELAVDLGCLSAIAQEIVTQDELEAFLDRGDPTEGVAALLVRIALPTPPPHRPPPVS